MNPIIHKRAIQSSLAQLGAVSIRWIRQVAVWLQPYRSAILPWVILCMAFILRVAALGQHELNGDEGFSWAFLKLPYLEIVITIELMLPQLRNTQSEAYAEYHPRQDC